MPYFLLLLQAIYPTGVPGKSESPFSGEPAGEGNKRDSELSQNMRPDTGQGAYGACIDSCRLNK